MNINLSPWLLFNIWYLLTLTINCSNLLLWWKQSVFELFVLCSRKENASIMITQWWLTSWTTLSQLGHYCELFLKVQFYNVMWLDNRSLKNNNQTRKQEASVIQEYNLHLFILRIIYQMPHSDFNCLPWAALFFWIFLQVALIQLPKKKFLL